MDVSTLYYDITTKNPVELRHICEEQKADWSSFKAFKVRIVERLGYYHTVCNFSCRNGL